MCFPTIIVSEPLLPSFFDCLKGYNETDVTIRPFVPFLPPLPCLDVKKRGLSYGEDDKSKSGFQNLSSYAYERSLPLFCPCTRDHLDESYDLSKTVSNYVSVPLWEVPLLTMISDFEYPLFSFWFIFDLPFSHLQKWGGTESSSFYPTTQLLCPRVFLVNWVLLTKGGVVVMSSPVTFTETEITFSFK